MTADRSLHPAPLRNAGKSSKGGRNNSVWSPTSVVHRELRDERDVYVKRYLAGDWGCTEEIVRTRAAREAELIRRISQLSGFRGRLGVPQLVSSDPDAAQLVTAAIPGETLQQMLVGSALPKFRVSGLRVFFTAGRWLRVFQSLSILAGDNSEVGSYDPIDLVEYCNVRFEKLQDLGYRGLDESGRCQIRTAVKHLVGLSDEADQRLVWGHCDYSSGNMIWDGEKLTAIDFGMAHLAIPLLDVTYFIHRLEMLRVYFPWRRWPIGAWTRAFLRGYGRPDAMFSPTYNALMIRHYVCRLQTYVRRPPRNLKQRIHNTWVRRRVRNKLLNMSRQV